MTTRARGEASTQEGTNMSDDDTWERKRAVISLLDIARDALVSAMAISPGNESGLQDALFEARKSVLRAADYAKELPQ